MSDIGKFGHNVTPQVSQYIDIKEVITITARYNTKGINPLDRAFSFGVSQELGPLYGPPQFVRPQPG